MKLKKINIILSLIVLGISVMGLNGCKEDEEIYGETRLFRPVLKKDLYTEGNVIFVEMGSLKEAKSYTLEISRDTFETIDYHIETEESLVIANKELLGEDLLWNTLYQVRAKAHSADPKFDSKIADLGAVRTQRFPSILNVPESFDVTDVAARLTWGNAGAAVTGIRIYAIDDLQLNNPLGDLRAVSSMENEAGEAIVEGLEPETSYQIAIFSDETLRGWVNYTTLEKDIDPNDPNVIDVRANTSPSAVSDAVAAAHDGAIILVKRGVTYDLPRDGLSKSVTIRSAYGFGKQKAKLYTTGNWDLAEDSNIDHIRFIDLEIRGANYGGNYVFNPQRNNVRVGELVFENCEVGTVRGILRIRGNIEIDRFEIRHTLVDSIGGYGIFTTDTDPNPDNPTARVNHVVIENSTFNKVQAGFTSRNNSTSIIIDGSTFANFITSSNRVFRYRGGDGNNNVTGGIVIKNSIFGHGWDESDGDNYAIRGIEGLGNTTFDIVNNYSTKDFGFSDSPIPGFPIGNYSGGQADLWVNPSENNFNFRDMGFSGRFDTGDVRWRVVL